MVTRLSETQTRVHFVPPIVQHLRRSLVQRFAAHSAIITTLSLLHNAPKDDDGESQEETPPENVGHAVWTIQNLGDAGIVSRSPDGLPRMMIVVVVTCQESD